MGVGSETYIVPVDAVNNFIQQAASTPQGLPPGARRFARDPATLQRIQGAVSSHAAAAASAPPGSEQAKAVALSFLQQAGQAGMSLLGNLLAPKAPTQESRTPLGPAPYTPPSTPVARPTWHTTVKESAPIGAVVLIAALGLGALYLAKRKK